MLLALLSSLVEARSMGSEVREAAVRVGKPRSVKVGEKKARRRREKDYAGRPGLCYTAADRARGGRRVAQPAQAGQA